MTKIKDLGILPGKKEHTEWCLTGNIGGNILIHTKETACICGVFYFNQVLSQIEDIEIDEILKKNGWVRKMSVEKIEETIRNSDAYRFKGGTR